MSRIDAEAYPARNRVKNTLSPLYQEVEYDMGVLNILVSELHRKCSTSELHALTPFEDLASILSGKPACIFRTEQVEVALTTQELCRLLQRKLREQEMLRLLEEYGPFHHLKRCVDAHNSAQLD